MTRACLAVAALAASLLFAAQAGAIVGGKPVPPGQFGYVANVRIGGSFGCTGTLIDQQWVLTAGHCGSATGSASQGYVPSSTAWPPSAYSIVLGSVYADGRGGEKHAVSQVKVDSDYFVTNGSGNDVTLMKLDKPSGQAPVRIAAVAERQSWRAGVMSTIAGFGDTQQNAASPPDQMQMAQVPITTDQYCASAYPNGFSTFANDGSFDPKSMFCAGYPQGGTDTCNGDSGGPLLVDAAGKVRLVGATSFGAGCAQPGKPGVYARLAEGPIRDFIRTVVPAAFAPEPTKSTSTKRAKKNKKKRRVSRRCAQPRGHAHAGGESAHGRCGRRASRR